MSRPGPDDEAAVREGAQRVVGVAALRRIGKLVGEFEAEDNFKRRASRDIIFALVLLALAALLLYLAAPDAVPALFRSLS